MGYAIVFSSNTGNTERVAKRIRKLMGEEGCVAFGSPDEVGSEACEAGLVFVGSWTDKGQASAEISSYLPLLGGKRVFLFGTCGFGASEEYFNQVLARFRGLMPTSSELAGSFMCQGKMPASVRERYEAMLGAAEPESAEAKRAQLLLENYDEALVHPNNEDFHALAQALREAGLI